MSRAFAAPASFAVSGMSNYSSPISSACVLAPAFLKETLHVHLLFSLLDICFLLRHLDIPDLLIDFRVFFCYWQFCKLLEIRSQARSDFALLTHIGPMRVERTAINPKPVTRIRIHKSNPLPLPLHTPSSIPPIIVHNLKPQSLQHGLCICRACKRRP